MKADIIIKIRMTSDHDAFMETVFKECDLDAILANPEMKYLHGLVKQFQDMFIDEPEV